MIHDCYRLFHKYSIGNQILALLECKARNIQLGPLASYQRWKELGRHVRKGEKAIPLIMPITVKRRADQQEGDEDTRTTTIFLLKRYWFVLSQTDGEPYEQEPLPDWDKDRALSALEITEEPFQELNGNMQGYATRNTISVSPVAGLPHKTRFHEAAHILLGHTSRGALTDGEQLPRSLIEAEAESVALICVESLGLPGAEFCRGYIQNWLDGGDIPERSAQRIFTAADRILKAGVESKDNGKEKL